MTSCWYRLREHGVPIWRSNQIWLYYNDDCKIMALNPLENSPGLLNCLSDKSKIGTDNGVSLSYLIKHYRQLNVIFFLEHQLNFAPKTVIRFGWMWGVGGLTESLGSFPYIYAQLALELHSLSPTSRPRLVLNSLGIIVIFHPWYERRRCTDEAHGPPHAHTMRILC